MECNTQRLYLRPISSEDKESIFSYRSDPETNQYLGMVPNTVDDIAAFIEKSSAEIDVPGTWFQLVIVERTSDRVIGDIGIHFLESDAENKQVEIGYTLDEDFRGKGFATEALTAVIDYLIHTLEKHRIIASVDPTNLNSIKLLERLGFRKEAHFVESLFFHGKWVDDVIYAVLAREWKASR